MSDTPTARGDWEDRIGRRSGQATTGAVRLPAPSDLHAAPGRGQVTLDWKPVEGAVGYLLHRADGGAQAAGSAPAPDAFAPLDHHGGDVLAVPHGPYTDTTGEPGRPYWYAVAAIADVDSVGELSDPVRAAAEADGAARVHAIADAATVVRETPRPWRPMIGSEHLSHLLSTETTGGRPIGAELRSALTAAHTELGVETVRAHGILCDDLGVYREVDGEPVHDFTGVDAVYDAVLDIGLRPVVEISFMPRDLAADPTKTVFDYGAIVSPPKDWDRWADLVRALVAHLAERYGLDELRERWSFEVWNEANLEVFWSGTPEEFWRLYDVTARAVRDVDPGLRVGGPSSAAAGWVDPLLEHVAGSGAPLDFVSTHTYGSPPLDLRATLARHGRPDAAIWWTEWGVTPTHFNPVNDSVYSAAFLARGMHSSAGRLDALSYWVVSDHFEELGRPPALLHGGFGLRTVGELRKPRWWALAMLDRLGPEEVALALSGDGADGMVQAWATRDVADGRVTVLVWNHTLDQSKADGAPLLERTVTVTVDGLTAPSYRLAHHRVDATHSNLAGVWAELSNGADWPDEAGWASLRAADHLAELEPARDVDAAGGRVELETVLPMPALSLIELVPTGR